MRKLNVYGLCLLIGWACVVQARVLKVGIAEICETEKLKGSRPNYPDAVYKGGGVPFILRATTNRAEVARALNEVDAVMLCGGEDVEPARYGARPSPKLGGVNLERDAWEFLVLEEALKRKMPIVGMCRGEQIINVFFGGTLYQDLPSEYPNVQRHRGVRHTILIDRDSRLGRLVGANNATVNSAHHQAVKKLAPGFRVVARAEDGVVEAIEHETLPVAAVQFHPEALYVTGDDTFKQLFTQLLGWAGKEPIRASAPSAANGPLPTWRHVGAGMGGNSFWLTADPNDDRTLFYAPDVGGVYRTKDGGKTWRHLGVEFSHTRRIGTWTLITVAPSDSKTVYAVANQRYLDLNPESPADAPYVARFGLRESGFVRSRDGGETWEELPGSPLRGGAVAVDPEDANTIWVAGPGYVSTCLFGFRKTYDSHGEGWVACSKDGGQTWRYAYAGCADSADANARKVCYSDLVVDRNSPKGARTLYLSGNGGGVWKSTDDGASWHVATNGLASGCVGALTGEYDAQGKLVLFAAACFSPTPEAQYPALRRVNRAGIYRSADGGATWEDVSGNLDRNIGRYRISVSPQDLNVMYTAQVRGTDLGRARKCTLKTTDGGKTWQPCMDCRDKSNLAAQRWNNHYDYLGSPDTRIVLSRKTPGKAWFADAGCMIWESDDAGAHWKIITSDQVAANRFKTRGMDNSYILSLSVAPKNKDFLLMCCHDFDFLSSVDGGASFFSGGQTGGIAASGAADGCFGFMSVCHDPNDPLRAYAGSKGWSAAYSEGSVFLTTTDGGRSWHAPETNPKGMKLGDISDILSDEMMKRVEKRHGAIYWDGKIRLHNWAVRHIAISPKTGRLFASKRTGIYYSDNKGGDWKRATFEGIGKDCDWAPNYVQVDAQSGKVFAVVSYLPIDNAGLYSSLHVHVNTLFDTTPDAHAGLYVSEDDGATFRKWGKLLPEMILPTHFALAPDGAVYLGTLAARVKDTVPGRDRVMPAGLWKTTDGGNTWQRLLTGRKRMEGRVEGIAVNPQRPNVIYAAMREATCTPALAAILRSKDGGKTWQDISGAASHYTYTWLSLSAADPNDILVGTAGGGAYIGHEDF